MNLIFSKFNQSSRESAQVTRTLFILFNIMWILLIISYFIWIPICFIIHWAWMCAYDHKINWKNITIGEFLIGILYSIVPLVNFIVTLMSFEYLYRHGICFTFLDKPLFHERN